jgi:predicted DNA-binding transcriptional regulator AlpA
MTRRVDLSEAIRTAADERARRKPVRLLTRNEVMERVPVSYVTIWKWMQANKFPRSREVGGKAMWIEEEIDSWIRNSPVVNLRDDPESSRSNNFHRSKRGRR